MNDGSASLDQLLRLRIGEGLLLPYLRITRIDDGYLLTPYQLAGLETISPVHCREARNAVTAARELAWRVYASFRNPERSVSVLNLYEVFMVDPGTKPRKSNPPKVLSHSFVIATDESKAIAKAALEANLTEDVDSAQFIVSSRGIVRSEDD